MAGQPLHAEVLAPRAALAAALATIGLPFALSWSRVHEADARSFGAVIVAAATVGIGLALAIAARRRTWRGPVQAYLLIVASAAGVMVIASRSDSIIAEGVLTAMELPVALLGAGLAASLADLGLASGLVRGVAKRRPYVLALVAVLSVAIAWRLPIVQFAHPPQVDSIHPVLGGWYAFMAGASAGALAAPVKARRSWLEAMAIVLAAMALGYASQAMYGAVIALLGAAVVFPPLMARSITNAARPRQ